MGSKRAHNKQSKMVRARTVGFRARNSSATGQRVLKRRRAKGRWTLAATSVSASKKLTGMSKNKALPRRRK